MHNQASPFVLSTAGLPEFVNLVQPFFCSFYANKTTLTKVTSELGLAKHSELTIISVCHCHVISLFDIDTYSSEILTSLELLNVILLFPLFL